MKESRSIDEQIESIKCKLSDLDAKREELKQRLDHLLTQKISIAEHQETFGVSSLPAVSRNSPENEKIGLFRSLFRGRDDVFPKRFESKRTGKSGYQPVCRNEWVRPVCRKPKVKCGNCENRDFVPLSDDVIRNHLIGFDPVDPRRQEFVIGVYPILPDETCWFLAVDFDKATWKEDAEAYLETCTKFGVPAALERSRSGNGGHIWIFFAEPIPAKLARQLGAFMLTCATSLIMAQIRRKNG